MSLERIRVINLSDAHNRSGIYSWVGITLPLDYPAGSVDAFIDNWHGGIWKIKSMLGTQIFIK